MGFLDRAKEESSYSYASKEDMEYVVLQKT